MEHLKGGNYPCGYVYCELNFQSTLGRELVSFKPVEESAAYTSSRAKATANYLHEMFVQCP
jgi:hypothetical protein